MYGIIYKATNKTNGKVYVGQTTRELKVRIRDHIGDSNRDSHYIFHKALKKYGKDNFEWKIIDEAKSDSELNEKEIYWIKFYHSFVGDTKAYGYNMSLGGLGGNFNKGDKCHQSKLKTEDIINIKNYFISGLSLQEVCDKYQHVTKSAISSMQNNRTWVHVNVDGWVEYLDKRDKDKDEKYNTDKGNLIKIKNMLMRDIDRKTIIKSLDVTENTISQIVSGKYYIDIYIDGWEEYKRKISSKFIDKAKNVKEMLMNGLSNREISEKLNVRKQFVSDIRINKAYTDVYVNGWEEYIKLENVKGYALNQKEVVTIKKLLMKKEKVSNIARLFNVSYTTIKNIAINKTWGGTRVEGWDDYIYEKGKRLDVVDIVPEIKKLIVNGLNNKEISEILGIDRQAINDIRNDKTYKYIDVDGWSDYILNKSKK